MNPSVGKPALPPEEKLDIEVVDDRPEAERARPAPTLPVEQIAEHHAEVEEGELPEDARKRIKSLKYSFREAQRQKNAAERERDEAIEYIKRVRSENESLRGQLTTGERVLIDQAKGRTDAQVAAARENYRRALTADDPDQLVKAHEELARAVAENERVSAYKARIPEQAPPEAQRSAPPPQPQERPQQEAPVDPRYADFVRRNQWWQRPGYEPLNSYAFYLHADLVSQGIVPAGETYDDYWSQVDRAMSEKFPELYVAESGNGRRSTQPDGGQAQNGARAPSARPGAAAPRPVTVTSGSRTSGGPVKVRLNQSQVTMARRLGLTEEQYAREWLKTGGA